MIEDGSNMSYASSSLQSDTSSHPPGVGAAPRVRVHGRATLTPHGKARMDARIYDISQSGISLILDHNLAIGTKCHLHCKLFQQGQHHDFALEVTCMRGTLMSGNGFRLGFQFGTHDQRVADCIEALMR
ncbi:MAG: PilZ domain-containing protein [Rhodoferax sp.]